MGKGAEYLIFSIQFLGNAATLWCSYNGAWWFVSTYIMMVLLSPLVFGVVQEYSKIVAILAFLIYFIFYVM